MTGAGFVVASTVLFVAVARAFGSRRPLLDTVIGLVLCAVPQIGFTWGLGLRLPAGIFAGFLKGMMCCCFGPPSPPSTPPSYGNRPLDTLGAFFPERKRGRE